MNWQLIYIFDFYFSSSADL